ncbi:MAG: M55 family metallopeptidase [Bacillota bacterium]
MRVFISADIEGVSGVVAADQTSSAGGDYDRARRLMTGEVNAAIDGAMEAGAEDVVVNDAHGNMRNILIEELRPEARLLTGSPKILGMMEGIDQGFDFCAFVGYHARAGSAGVLNHTISGGVVCRVQMNGREVGEAGLNAVLAGHYGIPLAMLSGDADVCRQVGELVPGVVTVAVKEAAGRYAALCISPERARNAIREGVIAAAQKVREGALSPLRVETPVRISLAVSDTAMADLASMLPGSEREAPLEVAYEAEDARAACVVLRAMITLASSSRR